VNRLAGKGGNFLSAIEEFYAEHGPRTLAGLRNHTLLLTAMGVDLADLASAEGCNARKQAVIEAAGQCTAANLKETIKNLTAKWLPTEEDHAAA
jgi:hypothetical protein